MINKTTAGDASIGDGNTATYILASGSRDRNIAVWDAAKGIRLFVLVSQKFFT